MNTIVTFYHTNSVETMIGFLINKPANPLQGLTTEVTETPRKGDLIYTPNGVGEVTCIVWTSAKTADVFIKGKWARRI